MFVYLMNNLIKININNHMYLPQKRKRILIVFSGLAHSRGMAKCQRGNIYLRQQQKIDVEVIREFPPQIRCFLYLNSLRRMEIKSSDMCDSLLQSTDR